MNCNVYDTMASNMVSKKPYLLEDCKAGPHDKISEPEFERWKGVLLDNIKKNKNFTPLLSSTWQKPSVTNRGLTGDTATEKSQNIDALLQHISHYGPAALQRDITRRSKSLADVWQNIRTWAGLKSSGATLHAYFLAKRSWNPETISHTDFYYRLFNAKEDCMLSSNGQIKYEGSLPTQEEEMSAASKSQVVLDWLDAIGGPALVEHVFRIFNKELQSETMHDIVQRIIDSLDTIIIEAGGAAEVREAKVNSHPNRVPAPANEGPVQVCRITSWGRARSNSYQRRQGTAPPRWPPARPSQSSYQPPPASQRQTPSPGPPCQLCTALKRPQAASHGTGSCFQINPTERAKIRSALVEENQQNTYEDDQFEEEYTDPVQGREQDIHNYENLEEKDLIDFYDYSQPSTNKYYSPYYPTSHILVSQRANQNSEN